MTDTTYISSGWEDADDSEETDAEPSLGTLQQQGSTHGGTSSFYPVFGRRVQPELAADANEDAPSPGGQ